jgi:hypothetical protein
MNRFMTFSLTSVCGLAIVWVWDTVCSGAERRSEGSPGGRIVDDRPSRVCVRELVEVAVYVVR